MGRFLILVIPIAQCCAQISGSVFHINLILENFLQPSHICFLPDPFSQNHSSFVYVVDITSSALYSYLQWDILGTRPYIERELLNVQAARPPCHHLLTQLLEPSEVTDTLPRVAPCLLLLETWDTPLHHQKRQGKKGPLQNKIYHVSRHSNVRHRYSCSAQQRVKESRDYRRHKTTTHHDTNKSQHSCTCTQRHRDWQRQV